VGGKATHSVVQTAPPELKSDEFDFSTTPSLSAYERGGHENWGNNANSMGERGIVAEEPQAMGFCKGVKLRMVLVLTDSYSRPEAPLHVGWAEECTHPVTHRPVATRLFLSQ
jgi:hypothetical protein